MKTLIKQYKFDPIAKTIQFSDKNITLDTLLVITNVTDNIIIYNFAAPTKGGIMSDSILTLTCDTSTMSDTDTLQIFADIEDGSQNIMYRILQMLSSPLGYDKSLQRQRGTVLVESGTVTQVSTVATLSNTVLVGGIQAQLLVNGQNVSAWQSCVRNRIT